MEKDNRTIGQRLEPGLEELHKSVVLDVVECHSALNTVIAAISAGESGISALRLVNKQLKGVCEFYEEIGWT